MFENRSNRVTEIAALVLAGLAAGRQLAIGAAATGAGVARLLSLYQRERMAAELSPARLAREARLLAAALASELDHPTDEPAASLSPAEVADIPGAPFARPATVRPRSGYVEALERSIVELRGALSFYAKPGIGWDETEHADAYERSRRIVPLSPKEIEEGADLPPGVEA